MRLFSGRLSLNIVIKKLTWLIIISILALYCNSSNFLRVVLDIMSFGLKHTDLFNLRLTDFVKLNRGCYNILYTFIQFILFRYAFAASWIVFLLQICLFFLFLFFYLYDFYRIFLIFIHYFAEVIFCF
jgi:hypothetical protein